MASSSPVRVEHARPHEPSRLVLTGRVTVECAAELHAVALELSGRGCDVGVSCDGAEYLDAAAIQVILCLGRDLVGRGKRFQIQGVSDALGRSLHLAGLGDRAT